MTESEKKVLTTAGISEAKEPDEALGGGEAELGEGGEYVRNRRNTAVKPRAHYRRPTIMLQRAENFGQVDNALMERLKQAKESGAVHQKTLMGLTVFAANGDAFDDPFTIGKYPVGMQLAFRRKLYALLSIEMIVTLILSSVMVAVPAVASFAEKNPLASFEVMTYGSIAAVVVALGILYISKYTYPANYLCLGKYSVFFSS